MCERFHVNEILLDVWRPRYNAAPSQNIPVIVQDDRHRVLRFMRWGLIPHWSQPKAQAGAKKPFQLINLRAESLDTKPAFHKLARARRCLIPADGFYEWRPQAGGSPKQPYRIRRADNGLFAMAGVWDTWTDPQGRALESCLILTTQATPLIQPIHGRMPVILSEDFETAWLNIRHSLPARLAPWLHPHPYPEAQLTAYPVSRAVNSPQNDSPDCLKTADPSKSP